MKRIISFILCVVMLCSCISIHAMASQGDPTVALSSAQGSAGQTVSITAAISNNPGIVSMYLKLEYDVSRLQLISVVDHGLLNGQTFGRELEDYPYALTWDDSVAASNNTANGDLVTLSFKIREDAPAGDAEIRLSNADGILDFDLNDVDFAFVSGRVSVVEHVAHSEITSADMELGTDISVNYYAALDLTHSAAKMRFTMNGTETVVDGVETEEEGIFVYSFKKISPQCMGDNIKAELILGDTILDVKEEYSVKTYCENTLAKSAEQLGMSAEKYAALRTLIADILKYGAKAQIYTGYKTASLVDSGVSGGREFVELSDDHQKYIDVSGLDSVEMISAGVYFDYTNSLYLKFTAPGMTEDKCYISVYNDETGEEKEYALSDCTLISEETSTYLLIMDPCLATGYNALYYVDLYAPNSRGRVVCQQSLEYSMAAYVYSMQNKTDDSGALTPMAQLARATYNYGLSASAYDAIAN